MKISNLNDVVEGEKETVKLWIERYEDETVAHTKTQSEMINAKSDLKDKELALKSEEIKLTTLVRQIEMLTN